MAQQHSPAPWRAIEADIFDAQGEIATVFGNHLPYEMDVGNAAFIVRACNAHYQMLEALKAALADIEASGNLSVPMIRAAIAAAEAEGR